MRKIIYSSIALGTMYFGFHWQRLLGSCDISELEDCKTGLYHLIRSQNCLKHSNSSLKDKLNHLNECLYSNTQPNIDLDLEIRQISSILSQTEDLSSNFALFLLNDYLDTSLRFISLSLVLDQSNLTKLSTNSKETINTLKSKVKLPNQDNFNLLLRRIELNQSNAVLDDHILSLSNSKSSELDIIFIQGIRNRFTTWRYSTQTITRPEISVLSYIKSNFDLESCVKVYPLSIWPSTVSLSSKKTNVYFVDHETFVQPVKGIPDLTMDQLAGRITNSFNRTNIGKKPFFIGCS